MSSSSSSSSSSFTPSLSPPIYINFNHLPTQSNAVASLSSCNSGADASAPAPRSSSSSRSFSFGSNLSLNVYNKSLLSPSPSNSPVTTKYSKTNTNPIAKGNKSDLSSTMHSRKGNDNENIHIPIRSQGSEHDDDNDNSNSHGHPSPSLPSPSPSPSLSPSLPPHPPLSLRHKISFGLGHFSNDITASLWFSYLLLFLHSVLLLSPMTAGMFLLIGQVSDGICTPIVGLLSDYSSSRQGVSPIFIRRMWITLGSIGVLSTFPLLFHSPPEFLNSLPNSPFFSLFHLSPSQWFIVYYIGVVVLFQMSWASCQINHLSLVPTISKDPSERVILNSIRSIATILANVIVYCVAAWLLNHHESSVSTVSNIHQRRMLPTSSSSSSSSSSPSSSSSSSSSAVGVSPNDLSSFSSLSFIIVLLGSISSLIFFFGTRTLGNVNVKAKIPHPQSTSSSSSSPSSHPSWSFWLSDLNFYVVATVYLCSRMVINLSSTYIPLYLMFSLRLQTSSIAWVPLTIFASGFVSTCFCEHLTRRLGDEKLTLLATLITLSSSVLMYALPMEYSVLIYPLSILFGTACGVLGVSALSLICHLIHHHCESAAFVFGVMSFGDKVVNGVAIMMVQWMASAMTGTGTGMGTTGTPMDTEVFYRQVMLLMPGGASIIAAIVLMGMIHNKNKHKDQQCHGDDNAKEEMRVGNGNGNIPHDTDENANGNGNVPHDNMNPCDENENSSLTENTPLLQTRD